MELDFLDLVALFFFTMASAGFVLFTFRYARGSQERVWGIRACHLFGFIGVIFLRLSHGRFTESSLLIIASLVVSLLASEIASRFLPPEQSQR